MPENPSCNTRIGHDMQVPIHSAYVYVYVYVKNNPTCIMFINGLKKKKNIQQRNAQSLTGRSLTMSVVHEKCFLFVHLGSVKMVLGPLPVPSRDVKVPRYYFMNLGTSWDTQLV